MENPFTKKSQEPSNKLTTGRRVGAAFGGGSMALMSLLSTGANAQPIPRTTITDQSTSSTSPESSSTSETTSTVIVDPTSSTEASTTTTEPIIKVGRGTTTTFETPPTIPNVAEQTDNAATQDVLPRTE
ncbi:MAG TPA: hypothetical protein VLF90_03815 [Patescibacteria group bacterium]|nr:hypothetical protein [Patescibacteria group bacterium]